MNYLMLSKEISYALRHAPWEYELELDENGWVSVEQLLTALKENSKWESVTTEDLDHIIESSDKKRHELVDGKIRALYGHSIPRKIVKESAEPPAILFHGTARRFLESIENKGLLPKGRQYVHLSNDIETALQVGKRRDDKPTILEIDAKRAWDEGVKFYLGNDKVWLGDNIPSKYIKVTS
ncbi:RNA 2'-phosphotransferase [Clostridium weizhouense]|uniref:Probable RNA 2'-phosphotransferase n=1 Tax=Clostridium weizhouense TaxID=2859781 RepID=A0ABS7AUI0_9CLOT|nr:RNA 2'-phosphotransferase [Clostridium weizhouense]MBW6411913.1 RNA 2'-phosphotransferase [Clostridium weizhouense]